MEKIDWLTYPHSSGFLIFLLGGWLLFAIYHLLLFAKNRNFLYLLYGCYLISIIGYQFYFLQYQYFPYRNTVLDFLRSQPMIFAELSYLIYFIFTFRFLDIKKDFPRSYTYITRALMILAVYSVLNFVIQIVTNDVVLANQIYHGYVVAVTILSVITYVMFFRSKHPLRYYIIIGSLFLSIGSYLSLFLSIQDMANERNFESAYTFLYGGYLIETVLFALGLGHLQFLTKQEKQEAQQKLILQYQENQRLQNAIEDKLRQDVSSLTEQSRLDELAKLQMKYEKEVSDLKISVLRSQMNPHFIFNSLNSIKHFVIDNKKENAVYYLNKFSKLIRQILSSTFQKSISLSEEIELVELYVNIENIRFDNEIDLTIEVDKEIPVDTVRVPALVLQPFVENAIWHGLSSSEHDKKLWITVRKVNEHSIVIDIVDNGIGRIRAGEIRKRKMFKQESVGLKITEDRLAIFTREQNTSFVFEIEDLYNENGSAAGTKVHLVIPIHIG